ncbi:MAG: DUF1365 domain-containing protein [Ketobacter sp.]|nr:DUF1365 domain-containing protein [Ketobacter sp.]
MRSKIYKGVINHRRSDSIQHEFRYPLFMVYLDLDDIDGFFNRSLLWSKERFNWASYYRTDYLNPNIPDLKQAVAHEIMQKTGRVFQGSVFMLTHLRYLGINFNPATFYFCFEGDRLRYVVTEVTNTPWQERHTYVLGCEADDNVHNFTTRKQFHVSPFLAMDMEYRWKIETPGDHLRLYISNFQNNQRVFSAGLKLTKVEASAKNMNLMLLQYPAVTLKTIGGIYWQALRLWLKGARFNNHPKPSEDQAL